MGTRDLEKLLSKVRGGEQKSSEQAKDGSPGVNSQSSGADSTGENPSEDNSQSSEQALPKSATSKDIAITSESEKGGANVLEDNSQSSGSQTTKETKNNSTQQKKTPTKRGRKPSPDLGPGRVMSRSGKIIPERKVKAFRMSRKEITRFESVVNGVARRYADLVESGEAPDVSVQDAEVIRAMVTFFYNEIRENGYSESVEVMIKRVVEEVESRAGTVEERRQNK